MTILYEKDGLGGVLVEPDKNVAEVLVETLEKLGYEVTTNG
jgi:hypothetical protein